MLKDIRAHRFIRARNHLISLHPGYNRILKLLSPGTMLDRTYRFVTSRPLISDIGYRFTILPLTAFPQEREWGKYLMRLPTSPESKIPEWIITQTRRVRTIIDVGCGITPYAVHPAITNVPSLIGIDSNFALLFISSIFFKNTHQSHICADLSHGFPIPPKAADLVFSLNCFTYLYNQKETLRAMMQSVKRDGTVFIGDLHVSVDKNLTDWYPRPPSYYTVNSRTHYEVIDYDDLLARVSTGKHVRTSAVPFLHSKGSRYGIVFSPIRQ